MRKLSKKAQREFEFEDRLESALYKERDRVKEVIVAKLRQTRFYTECGPDSKPERDPDKLKKRIEDFIWYMDVEPNEPEEVML